MALTEERRARLLAYCRIEEPTDEELLTLEGLYDAAVGYMEGAGISPPASGTPRAAQYDLCVNYLVLDGYDRRDVTITGTIVADNPAFRRLINQLKLTEPRGEV
ncbi:head-tail connector protein [Intestinimonas timonensis]|uniref:head-tail connector protein n=1 Tax=Intestinimonas timonensis TaxID=1689270 RepID=UPI0024B26ACD|nr:head-tail connector protein [Intestinimonas timonensis]